MRYRLLAAPALLLASVLTSAAAAQRLPAVEAERYERCMALSRSDPEAAWDRAQEWHSVGGGHPAEHCAAVALIGLKRYAEAGKRLDKLAEEMARGPAELRGAVLGQAGQAWLLAGDPARALAALTEAHSLLPADLDLLTDRATAAAALGRPADAIGDLDQVIAADPKRADALTYRASAKRSLERLDEARADIEAALRLVPDSPDALLERGNILRLAGDKAGARRDWRRVVELAPKGEAAAAAKANLARLDEKSSETKTAPAKRHQAERR